MQEQGYYNLQFTIALVQLLSTFKLMRISTPFLDYIYIYIYFGGAPDSS